MTTTAQTICTEVRNRTDQAYSDEVSDTVMLTWVDASHRALYDLIIDKQIYNVSFMSASLNSTATVNPSNNVGFALPSDFYRMYRLDRVFGTGGVNVNVPACPPSQRNTPWLPSMPVVTPGGLYMNPVAYIIEPPNVLLIPGSQAAGTYVMGYYPTLAQLSTLASPILGLFDGTGWWEWMVLDVVEKLKGRLDQDASMFAAMKAEVTQRIEHAAPNRDVTYGMKLDPARGKQRFGWPFGGPTGL